MDQVVKHQWIEALRSGDYAQGAGTLRDGAQFCVMGVLTDLHARATGGEWGKHTHSDLYSYRGLYGTPALVVQQWAGITEQEMLYLQGQNDNGALFADLATEIEVYL